MPDQTAVQEPVVTPPAQPEVTPPAPSDPYALDETSLISLSPEQRASLDPILEGWKKKAIEREETAKKSVEETYKPHREKAEALDNLVKHPQFQQWWQSQQQQMMQGQNAQTQQAVSQSKPQDFATPEEWSQAVIDASNNDPTKLQAIQARMFSTMATPFVQRINQQQREIATKMEMKELMETHPDYKELDQIGLDDKGQGVSLLEHCLNLAEAQGRPLEEGYQQAVRWASSMKAKAQAQAMGIVQGKKDSITSGPSTSTNSGNVIYVTSEDEKIRRFMDDQLMGVKGVRYEVRKEK